MSQPGWENLLKLSEQMLNAAREADWELLNELENRRNPLLNAYFSSPTELQDTAELAGQLTWLQDVEHELLDLCLQKRDKLSAELQGLKKGKTAGDAYLSNAT